MTAGDQLIVLVDDEQEILDSYRKLLGQWYRVETFRTGVDLLEKVDRFEPALFIVDWLMPGMNGLDLCRRLREDRRFDPVPIVFFTGIDPTLENMRQAFQAGAQSFVSKHSAPDFIIIQINTLVNYSRLLARLFRDQQLIFSVLEHDMSNLLTGVTTGVEILTLHPALRGRELSSQTRSILSAAAKLRTLFGDLTEVLTFYRRGLPPPAKRESLEEIEKDLLAYLKGVDRKIRIRFPRSLKLVCDRKSLGRALYYLVRFLDSHIPTGEAIVVSAGENGEGIGFTAEVKGNQKALWEEALAGRRESRPAARRHDLLFLEYIRHAVRLHHADLSVDEKGGRTFFRLALPSPGTAAGPAERV